MRTIVYVDGFNLYYGAVRGTPYRWLDIQQLCTRLLLPTHQIVQIKYFTAIVSARKADPDGPVHQQIYLRALRTIPDLEIIKGHFLSHKRMMPLADSPKNRVCVIRTEEKGSDVNIATHMITDGFRDRYECCVLVSNDSDMLEPVKVVRGELSKMVGILNPHQHQSKVLQREATFVKRIRQGLIAKCQFADRLSDDRGTFQKPRAW